MAAALPVTQSIQISKKKSYSLVLSLCNDNAPGAFSAEATPVFREALSINAYATPADTQTASLSFVPGDLLRFQTGTKQPTGSTRSYPILDARSKVTLACSKQGTAVTTVFPFGNTFKQHAPAGSPPIAPLYLAVENAPTDYTYTVKYNDSVIAKGDVTLAIKVDAAPPAQQDFSVCSVKVN